MHETFHGIHLDLLALLIALLFVVLGMGTLAVKADKYQQQLKKEKETQIKWKN